MDQETKDKVGDIVKDLGQDLQKALLRIIEVEAEKLVTEKFELLVDKVVDLIKEKIPGTFDDVVLEGIKPQLKVEGKAFLLAQIEKISDEV